MIYNKPKDINLRVFPSLSTLAPKRRSKNSTPEIKSSKPQPQKTISENRAPVKPVNDFQTEPITDISSMSVVDGVPMLEIEKKPIKNTVTQNKRESATLRPQFLSKPTIDISAMPDIEGVPILKLPDEIHPLVLKEQEEIIASTIEEKAEEVIVPIDIPEGTKVSVAPEKEEIILEKKSKAETTPQKEKKKKEKTFKEKVKKNKTPKSEKIKLTKENKPLFLKAASFFIMLYIGTIIAFMIPLRPTYSETEKRNLKEFPEFSVNALLSGSYFNNINTWFSDTFPYREILTKANTRIKDFYGFDSVVIHGEVEEGDEIPDTPLTEEPEKPQKKPQKEETTEPVTMPNEEDLHSDNGNPHAEKPDVQVQSLGAIIIADDAGYEYYSFSEELAPRFINSVGKIKETAKSKEAYALLIPTSIDITLNEALRSDIKSANQEKALNYFNASFKNTKVVDGIYKAEKAHKDEYTYFRTDHHWTALGAYYAYEEFAKEKGIEPIPLSKYKTRTFDNFLGTFYTGSGQTSKLARNPDHVEAYLPFNEVTCHIDEGNGNAFYWDVIKDVSDYGQSLKYVTFIGGDNALTTLKNADNPKGETCIVIKESFGNAFVPFLIPHYSTIYVIDPRHYEGTLSDFVKDKEIDDVIFIANISTTRNYIYIDAMEEFIQ